MELEELVIDCVCIDYLLDAAPGPALSSDYLSRPAPFSKLQCPSGGVVAQELEAP